MIPTGCQVESRWAKTVLSKRNIKMKTLLPLLLIPLEHTTQDSAHLPAENIWCSLYTTYALFLWGAYKTGQGKVTSLKSTGTWEKRHTQRQASIVQSEFHRPGNRHSGRGNDCPASSRQSPDSYPGCLSPTWSSSLEPMGPPLHFLHFCWLGLAWSQHLHQQNQPLIQAYSGPGTGQLKHS